MSYSLSQLDAIGDVDPVAEADVYLAYGRDLQAEEILKEALRSAPDRLAVRVKLLEVYAKRRDTKGYEFPGHAVVRFDEWRRGRVAQDPGTGAERSTLRTPCISPADSLAVRWPKRLRLISWVPAPCRARLPPACWTPNPPPLTPWLTWTWMPTVATRIRMACRTRFPAGSEWRPSG